MRIVFGPPPPPFNHPMRRQILRCMHDWPEPCGGDDLAEWLSTEPALVAYHLRVLRTQRVISLVTIGDYHSRRQVYRSNVEDEPAVLHLLMRHAKADERLLPRQQPPEL